MAKTWKIDECDLTGAIHEVNPTVVADDSGATYTPSDLPPCLILKSDDGTKAYKITISNTGVISTTDVTA